MSPVERTAEDEGGSSVDRVYRELKNMAVTFMIRPGERLNEVEYARRLNVSRTPLREALNRLVSEGFLTVMPSRGFFARPLDAKQIFDLYELRGTIETAAYRLAAARASEQSISALSASVGKATAAMRKADPTTRLRSDELFHEGLVALSCNQEMVESLRRLNAKISFVRWLDMRAAYRGVMQDEHMAIVQALRDGKLDKGAAVLASHIERRLDQIVEIIKTGFAEIYMREPDQVLGTVP